MSIFVERLNLIPRIQVRSLITLLVLLCPPLVVGFFVHHEYSLLLMLGGLLVLGTLVLIFDKPEATTVVVLFVMYANVPVVLKQIHGLPNLLAASFFLLLGLPLLHYLILRGQPILINRIFFVMVAYLGVLLVSATFSGQVHESTERIVTYAFEGLVLYLLILNTVRTRALLHQAIWALILAGVLMGSFSLYQEATRDYDNDFGGMAIVDNSVIGTGQVDAFGKDIKRPRLSGPIGEKNRYAQVMVVLLPLALFRFWSERLWVLRLAATAACIPIVGGVLLSFSRGAGVATVITLLAMVVMRTIKVRHLLVFALVGYLCITIVAPDYLYRLSTTSDVAELATGNAQEAGGSVKGRATENLAAFYIFLDHPLLGVGPGQTNRYTTEYGNEVGYRRLEGQRRAHNMYLEEMSDTGLLGFTLLMSIIGMTVSQLVQLRRYWSSRRPDIAYTAASFLLAIMAYLFTAIFLHLSYIRYFWLLIALAGAAIQVFSPTGLETGDETEGETAEAAEMDMQRGSSFSRNVQKALI